MGKRLTMILASLLLCVGAALAQTKVTGIVLSQDDGQPVVLPASGVRYGYLQAIGDVEQRRNTIVLYEAHGKRGEMDKKRSFFCVYPCSI